MRLFRRKLWGDRVTWLIAALATVAVIIQWQTRHGAFRSYLLAAWLIIVGIFLAYGEFRIGRKQLRRGRDAMFLGLAAFVGEERVMPDRERQRGWTGTAAGALAFEPQGVRWAPRNPTEDGPAEMSFAWPDVYSWRLEGVVPFIWRASGYLLLSIYGGRELVFHVHGIRSWRRALREAMIVGPTLEAKARGVTVSEMPEPEPVPEPPVEPLYYETVIGLECHVELSTSSKMFCGCPTTFGTPPNTQICPVCTGQPGTLPVPNREAIEDTLRIALALNCAITPESYFHRKNYFYPDMPKNYQISQYDIPLATDGYLEFEADGDMRRVGIERVHLEEDTGKTIHAGEGGRIGGAEHALIDYNRAGIPLVEIVSAPQIYSPDEARAYVAELRTLLRTLNVSDVRMEEGSLRVDANVSVRPQGSRELGTKVEVKNMNSVRSVQRALAYEVERQTELVRNHATVVQETRHFDEATGRTIGGRAKEYSSDYRYFRDPDLVPIAPTLGLFEQIRASLPELPMHRRMRFVTELGLSPVEARTLAESPGLADAFEAATRAYGGDGHAVSRWYLGELAQLANERGVEPHEVGVSPEHLAELQKLVDDGKVSISLAKGDVLRKVVETGRSPSAVVEEAGLTQIGDEAELAAIVDEVIASSPEIVQQIRGGKAGAVNALVGQVMKQTRGQANAQVVQRLFAERLGTADQAPAEP